MLARLGDRDAYVRNVLDTMRKLARQNGPVVVRIGITGTGTRPSYRVDRADGSVLAAFDAQTHEPFTDVDVSGRENWSTGAMTFQEVEDLLRSIRRRG